MISNYILNCKSICAIVSLTDFKLIKQQEQQQQGGRTIHSTFKVPVSKYDELRCIVNNQSEYADYFRSIDVFILDEASMISKPVLEAIDA